MIPILYDKNETTFVSNGLGRLRDMISAVVTEERNGVYELDFEYPVSADDFNDIQIGRIIGVTHDESGDIQPFDIVSYTKPIDGVVSFHCTHISYRQSYLTVTGSNINSLASAFTLLKNSATPTNPFTYETDKVSTGYLASADGVPKTVRSMLGGIEGSILDAYGGEYEWDKFRVILHSARGEQRNFSIRYGVNMLDYNEEYDISGTYSSCIPYWTDGTTTIVGDRQDGERSTVTGRGECVPLDVSDKFDSSQGAPTKAQVNSMGLSVMNSKNPMIPSQNIRVEFVRLQDMGYESLDDLLECKLCDTVRVVFPNYTATGQFKIVKTVWDVLADRYESMELGALSITLAEALGISNATISGGGGGGGGVISTSTPTANTISEFDSTAHMNSTDMTAQEVQDFVDNLEGGGGSGTADRVIEQGTSGIWTYRKWESGIAECWGVITWTVTSWSTWGSLYYSNYSGTVNYPNGLFISVPILTSQSNTSANDSWLGIRSGSDYINTKDHTNDFFLLRPTAGSASTTAYANVHAIGRWK